MVFCYDIKNNRKEGAAISVSHTAIESGILVQNLGPFALDEILDCGQCFRWRKKPDGIWCGVVRGTLLKVRQQGDTLLFPGLDEDTFLRVAWPYFDFDTDYAAINRQILQDPVLRPAREFAPGIRILRQEPFESLCTFIISQNNNIPRIQGIIDRLCTLYGAPLPEGGYTFPGPEIFASLTDAQFAPLRCGFRQKYLQDMGRKLCEGTVRLDDVAALPLTEARSHLQQIMGVGPKVADCVLLFGFHRLEAFPIDVWMKRAVSVLYPNGLPEVFGPYAGVAQQYIFHYARHHRDLFT